MPSIYSSDNTRIHYSEHKGKKETLIFIHGWAHNHTVWDREVKYFTKKGFHTIAIDLRGHGLSDKPIKPSAYHMKKFAQDIREIIVQNNIKRPILIGHSFGGMVLLTLEKLSPNIASKLIFVDSTYENPLKDMPIVKSFNITPLTKQLLKYILQHKPLQKKHFKEVNFSKIKNSSDFYYWLKGAKSIPVNSLVLCLKEMLRFNASKILPKIRVPCLLIEGEKDVKTPREVAIRMHKLIKDSQLIFIKNASHNTHLQNTKEINKIIDRFLLPSS